MQLTLENLNSFYKQYHLDCEEVPICSGCLMPIQDGETAYYCPDTKRVWHKERSFKKDKRQYKEYCFDNDKHQGLLLSERYPQHVDHKVIVHIGRIEKQKK